MEICSVPDYRGALIQVGAAVMALSWGGGRPGRGCLLLLLLMEASGGRAWPGCCPSVELGAVMLVQYTHTETVFSNSTFLPNQQLLVW